MYPIDLEQPYPFQQWWMAASSSEVTREIMPRTILDMPIVFYRKENGDPVAVSGLCPHRYLPMERGCLVGDDIRCGYHGFTFAPSGDCTKIPSQNDVPKNSRIRTYPLVEHGGTIWIWTGDPENADRSLLPDFEALGLGNGGWKSIASPLYPVNARYQLLIENLMDLSHISFVHSNSIPGGENIAAVPPELIKTENSLNIARMSVAPINPLLQMYFPDHSEPMIGQAIDAEYFGPHLIRTGGKYINPSENSDEVTTLGTLNFVHSVTPETIHSSHYFVNATRDFALDNADIDGFLGWAHTAIGGEDKEILEDIERNLQKHGTIAEELSCRADIGGFKTRRLLADQIEAEILRNN